MSRLIAPVQSRTSRAAAPRTSAGVLACFLSDEFNRFIQHNALPCLRSQNKPTFRRTPPFHHAMTGSGSRWHWFVAVALLTATAVPEERTCELKAAVDFGECTIERLPLSSVLPTPRQTPAVFFPTEPTRPLRNARFTALVGEAALRERLGGETVKLTSSNAFSDGAVRALGKNCK